MNSPCRTDSSVRMSKCEKSMPLSRRMSEIFREKPQRGTSGEPFMKRTTVDWFMSPRRRRSSSSGVSDDDVVVVPVAGALSV